MAHLTRRQHLINRRAVRRRRIRDGGGTSRRTILLFTMAGIAGVPLLGLAVAATIAQYWYNTYAEDYRPIEEMVLASQAQLTEVYDRGGPSDGILLGTLTNESAPLHDPVDLEDISTALIEATVSTEDSRFWDHTGFDPMGIGRAAYENYAGGGIGTGSGGSTITQQLAKNVYLSTDCELVDGVRQCVAPRTVTRKLKELVIAIELEQSYSKEQILEFYLNQVSYADRYVGAQTAADGYFRKSAADLTVPEAALLAGIPAAPTEYHPRLNCERGADDECVVYDGGRWLVSGAAKQRQEYVIDLMVDRGYLTLEDAAAAKEQPIYVYPGVDDVLAPAWIDNQIEPRLVRMCEQGILPMVPGTDDCSVSVHSAGYRVTTTLDWALTEQARLLAKQQVEHFLEEGCDCHNAAVVTIDPRSGQVIVYAPNIDRTNVTDPYVAGEIDQLMEINQPGSSLKPAIYLAWFDLLNKTPMSTLWDTSPLRLEPEEDGVAERVEIRNPRPGGGGEGLITARAGLGGSQNVPAFRAAAEVGMDGVIATAKKLGITTLEQQFDPTFRAHTDVYYGPSIATGGANIRAFDMAYMNATIANMGEMVGVPTYARTLDMNALEATATSEGDAYEEALRQREEFARGNVRLPGSRPLDPVVILQVEDANGNLLFAQGEPEREQVINPGSVWLLHSIMSDCTARFIIWGCGSSNEDYSLDFFVGGGRMPAGIKTGTQQGPTNSADTLEVWTNGYSRYAATAVWVGNSNNELVRDGPGVDFASAHAVLRTYKYWMSAYHEHLLETGTISEIRDFDEIQPDNVEYDGFRSPTTERGRRGGCSQTVDSWQRTDIQYETDCTNGRVRLPTFKRDEAIRLARRYGIATDRTSGTRPAATTAPSSQEPAATPTPQPAQPTSTPQPAETPVQVENPGGDSDSRGLEEGEGAPNNGNGNGGGNGNGNGNGGQGNSSGDGPGDGGGGNNDDDD